MFVHIFIYTEGKGYEATNPTEKEEKTGKSIASVAVRKTQVNRSTPEIRLRPCAVPIIYQSQYNNISKLRKISFTKI